MAQYRTITETASRVAPSPEWARIPKTGETLEGLFRSQLFALIKTGAVKSAAIKAPGAARTGMRLIHLPSLRAWINQHAVAEGEVAQ
jgi:hypothetical protein